MAHEGDGSPMQETAQRSLEPGVATDWLAARMTTSVVVMVMAMVMIMMMVMVTVLMVMS